MAIIEGVDDTPARPVEPELPPTLTFSPENIYEADGYKAPAIPTPLNPDYRPDDKDEAKQNISLVTQRFDDYKKSQLQSGTAIKITSGRVEKWVEEQAVRPPGLSDETWAKLQAFEGSDGGGGKWVPDIDGQLLLDEIEYAERLSKELKGSGGAAGSGAAAMKVRSALDIEGDKTDEITRQMKDFANRANLYYDLQADEQDYGFDATNQNIKSWEAQRDLGMATMPGGFAGKPSMQQSLSSILGPSLPDYVRPDYRLNEVVGLPGAQGFDDPDYDEYGMPRFAQGTEEFIPVRPMRIVSWPWSK